MTIADQIRARLADLANQEHAAQHRLIALRADERDAEARLLAIRAVIAELTALLPGANENAPGVVPRARGAVIYRGRCARSSHRALRSPGDDDNARGTSARSAWLDHLRIVLMECAPVHDESRLAVAGLRIKFDRSSPARSSFIVLL